MGYKGCLTHFLLCIGVAEKMSMSAQLHRSMLVSPKQHVWIQLGTTHADVTRHSMSEMAVRMDRVAHSHLVYTRS